jgi:hypothetical protein
MKSFPLRFSEIVGARLPKTLPRLARREFLEEIEADIRRNPEYVEFVVDMERRREVMLSTVHKLQTQLGQARGTIERCEAHAPEQERIANRPLDIIERVSSELAQFQELWTAPRPPTITTDGPSLLATLLHGTYQLWCNTSRGFPRLLDAVRLALGECGICDPNVVLSSEAWKKRQQRVKRECKEQQRNSRMQAPQTCETVQ